MRSRFGILEIVLSPLSDGESGEVLRDLLGPPGSQRNAAVYRTMVKAAGGFPMVLELLAQDWTANVDDSLALTFDSVTAEFGRRTHLAASLQTGVRQADCRVWTRVPGMPSTWLPCLDIASTTSPSTRSVIWGRGRSCRPCRNLVDHRILRDNGRGLEFVNEFIRTAAYLEVPSPVRRALHARVAESLIVEDTRGTRYLGLEIAWHAARGNRVSEVPIYLLRGARRRDLRRRTGCGEQGLELGIEATTPRRRTKRRQRPFTHRSTARAGAVGRVVDRAALRPRRRRHPRWARFSGSSLSTEPLFTPGIN